MDIGVKTMNKKGTTLIETIISIFLISVVVVAFLEALNVGITGTLNLSRKTSALNLAKTEMEFVKSSRYVPAQGNLSQVYDIAPQTVEYEGDIINYDMEGWVTNVSAGQALQKITINVSYLSGKQLQLIGYKAGREWESSPPPATGKIVTDVIEDMPFEQPGGWALGCLFGEDGCGTWTGYYHVFTTSQSAKISATWKFAWHNDLYDVFLLCAFTWGAPYIGIYAGVPDWVQRDSEGNYYDDGVVFRPGADTLSGCMPGCNNCDPPYSPAEQDPIIMEPGCSIDCGDDNWTYEHNSWLFCVPLDCPEDGEFEFTVTTPTAQNASTYTVLFFNGEDRVSFDTESASVTYVY